MTDSLRLSVSPRKAARDLRTRERSHGIRDPRDNRFSQERFDEVRHRLLAPEDAVVPFAENIGLEGEEQV